MAGVPTYDNFQATPNVPQAAPQQIGLRPWEAGQSGEEMQRFGQGVSALGDTAGKVAVDIQDQANQLRVEDAMNQARQHALDLTYNPQTGYASLKGKDALERPDGQALADEYGSKLRDGMADISGTLSNPQQQRMFALRSGELLSQFHGDVEKHMMEQFHNYHADVLDGSTKLAQQEAELNWNNPDKVNQAVQTVKANIAGMQPLSGQSADTIVALQNEAASGIHATVVKSAIENNNVDYANRYFNANKANMTGKDILGVQGQINTLNDAHQSLQAVQQSTVKYTPQFAPSDMDRLTAIVAKNESTNNQGAVNINTNGTKDIGIMQVNEKTAPEAAALAKLPWDEDKYKNDAGYNRALGQAYLTKQLQDFGSVDKALAAYNAGPQALKDAMAKSPNNWLSQLPATTQSYVQKGVAMFNSGAGSPQPPTKEEFVQDALGRLGDNPRTELVSKTREQAEKQYDLQITSRKEQGEQALAEAQKELIANGGNFSALSPATLGNLSRFDPGKYDDAMKFAKSIGNEDKATNMEAYADAASHPEKLAEMSDTSFNQYLRTNFSVKDQEKVAKWRADYQSGGTDDTAGAINMKAFNTTVDARLSDIGIDPKVDKTDVEGQAKIGNIKKFLADDIYDQQKQLGRKMNPQEIEQRVDTMFSRSTEVPGMWRWSSNSKRLMSMTVDDIPEEDKDAITKTFSAHGVASPTDGEIMRAYWTRKARKNG
jgi:soluble lytic murein transglycosylase